MLFHHKSQENSSICHRGSKMESSLILLVWQVEEFCYEQTTKLISGFDSGKEKSCFWWKIEPGSIVNKLEILLTGKAVVLHGDINMHISSSQSFMVNQVLGCGALSEMVSAGKVQTPEEDGESELQFLVRRLYLTWNLWGFCYLAGFGWEWKISMERWIFSYLNMHMFSSCGFLKLVFMPSLQTSCLDSLLRSEPLRSKGGFFSLY